MMENSRWENSISEEQLATLFNECFSGEPWNSSLTDEETKSIINNVRQQPWYIESNLLVNDEYVGAYMGMEIKKLPYEFESTITPQEFLEKCKSIYPAYTGEESRNLRNIFVSPTQQWKGYGDLLLKEFEQRVINSWGRYIILSTLQDWWFQKKWYEKTGYITFWETFHFWHSLVFMIKEL